jgi:hypothetical protein
MKRDFKIAITYSSNSLVINSFAPLTPVISKTVSLLSPLTEMNTATCDNVSEKVADKVELIDQKIRELEELKTKMINRVQECRSCCAPQTLDENCPILTLS